MRETPARRKIREAAERRGLVIEDMYWQPIGAMMEMSGREGGWTVFFKSGGHALGHNAADVVDWIERGLAGGQPGYGDGCEACGAPPEDPCDCGLPPLYQSADA